MLEPIPVFRGVREIEEILGLDGHTCSRIDAADRENKTQEEMER
jgi:hypothetical protein